MHRPGAILCAAAALCWIVGCGDDNEGGGGTPTASPTRTATPLPSETFVPFGTAMPLPSETPVPFGTVTPFGVRTLTRGPAGTATPTPTGLAATPTGGARPNLTAIPVPGALIFLAGTFVPGQTNAVRASLLSPVPVAGTQNDIRFDGTAVRVVADSRGEPDCSVNPAIDKNGTAFNFLPPGCDPSLDCEVVRAFVFALDNSDPIPSGTVLYQCNVAVEADAPPGTILGCEHYEAASPSGGVVRTDCDGAIVVPVPQPTSTPRPTPTRTPMTTAGEARIVLGGTFTPGETSPLRATLYSNVPVAGVQNDIRFDGEAARVVANASGKPDCSVNPAIDKNGTAFSFLPFGCDPATDCEVVRAFVLAVDNVDPIPPGSLLYQCNVAVAADAPPGTLLRCEGPGAASPGGEMVDASCEDVPVVVLPDPTPTPTPTPSPQAVLQVSRVEGAPGETVPIEVRLSSVDPGVEVAGLQVDLLLPAQLQVNATAAGASDCRVNPEIHKPDTAYGFLDGGRTVRAFVLSFGTNVREPIPASSVVFTCDATVSPDVLPGDVLPIGCERALGSTGFGAGIPMRCEAGEIAVRAN